MADPTLPARLAQARRERDLGQEALARLLGFSAQQVSRWERGIHYPSWRAQQRLIRELDLPDDFFDDDGEVAA